MRRWHQVTRISGIEFFVLALLSLCGVFYANESVADNNEPAAALTLSPLKTPDVELRLVPGPKELVRFVVAESGAFSRKPAIVALKPFWDADGKKYTFRFLGSDPKTPGNVALALPGQPLKFKASNIKDDLVLWGLILIKAHDESEPVPSELNCKNSAGSATLPYECDNGVIAVPVMLGNFGAAVKPRVVEIHESGSGKLTVDISQHRQFGDEISFELSNFIADGVEIKIDLLPGVDQEPVDKLPPRLFPKNSNEIDLLIDAKNIQAEIEHHGSLITAIGKRSFIDTPVTIKRKNWATDAEFSPVQDVKGESPLRLLLGASASKPVYGVAVSSLPPAPDNLDPVNDLEISLKNGPMTVPLWGPDSFKTAPVRVRTLQPGSSYQVVVEPRDDISPGSYPVKLRFSALNVDPSKWPEVTVTLVEKNHWFFAALTLFGAVILSFAVSKGAGTALRRKDLKSRINAIKRTSWLRSDRWGALPVVRAFARIARAEKVLNQSFFPKRVFRYFTTPDLVANEVAEVEERLKILARLNRLAIYWKAAPSAIGLKVSGVPKTVKRRARKKIRNIVDRMSQIGDGQKIGSEITSEIEAMEAWREPENMIAGYWASLQADIKLLTGSVRFEKFDYDPNLQAALCHELEVSSKTAKSDDEKKALEQALHACPDAGKHGVHAVREALSSINMKVPNDEAVESKLLEIESSDREVVRKLHRDITQSNSPGSLDEMVRVEDSYAYLKLILEYYSGTDSSSTRGEDSALVSYRELIEYARNNRPVEDAFDLVDNKAWALLQQEGVVAIELPNDRMRFEEFEPIDFRVVCNNSKANTYLFKHGLEYKWTIKFSDDRDPLTPVTSSTTVTQFIPVVANAQSKDNGANQISAQVVMHWREKSFRKTLPEKTFETTESSRFKDLSVVQLTERFGVVFALILAFVAGFQSDAFEAALAGTWREYLTLFVWGVGADQTRNFLQNLDKFKGVSSTT